MENLKKIQELTKTLERVESNLKEEIDILDFLLEHFTDGYWDWNVNTNVEYLSPKFKKQLGYNEDEMENKPESWMSICNEEDLNRAYNKINTLIVGETDEFEEILRFTHKKGDEIKILCCGKVVSRDSEGKAIRVVGVHSIIT